MLNGKKVLAIIPARAGSKRLKNKNILNLAGKPLISWTIDAAKLSKYIDTIIVSTDSIEIAKTAEEYGIRTPQLRPKELSTDTSTSFEVVEYCLRNLKEEFDILVLLQATSPLRNSIDIDEALLFYEKKNANAVVSVCKSEHSPLWANTLPENLNMDDFLPQELLNKRSQDLPTFYRLNGAIMISNIIQLLKQKKFILKEKTYAFIMQRERSIDIDEKIDFLLAETIINNSKK